MSIKSRWVRLLSPLLAAWLAWLAVQPAYAGLVGTPEVLSASVATQARAQVSAALMRADVRQELARLGANVGLLDQRVAALSDEEVQALAGRLESLPAGGDVLGLVVFVFLVLLFTDILGFTDVFPFVKKTVK